MRTILTTLAVLSLAATGCSDKRGAAGANSAEAAVIKIDGSSTVYPITEAVAEEFQRAGGSRVIIGVSGTGGGFKKFCAGDTAITGASRPIKAIELTKCAEAKREFIELPVAFDGIAVVVHTSNDWVDHITVDELKRIWQPEGQGKVLTWAQVRKGWPETPLRLYGPGVDSGTYDYFTKVIVGKEHSSRGDYTSSEDDNVLVQGVSRDKGGLAFFGFAYYSENADKLKVVPIKNGDGPPVVPTIATVADGTYAPLSRPIFIYASKADADRPEVAKFLNFWLDDNGKLAQEVGYIALPGPAYTVAKKRFTDRTLGSIFDGRGNRISAKQ